MSDKCNVCKRELEDGEIRFYILSATTETYVENAHFLMCVCLECALKILVKVEIATEREKKQQEEISAWGPKPLNRLLGRQR